MLDFQTNSHTEHESTQKEVKKLSRNLDLKADMAIINQVQSQFGRFALYEDLKKLH